MAMMTIEIPDELVPGIRACALAEGKEVEQFVSDFATAQATKWCQDLQVGPYWVGPVLPAYNADGTPYEAAQGE